MQKIWHSIFWKILSCACFACINVTVRYLSGGSPIALDKPLPIYTIMFFQNLIGVVILTYYIKDFSILRTKRPVLHTVRIVTAALGIGLWYLSLRYIPVTQVVALSFIAPILTVLGALTFLKERLNWQRALAVMLSLLGGFLITRPDQALLSSENYNWYMILPLIAAFVFSLDKVFTRQLLTERESPLSLAWYLLACIGPLCLLPCIQYGWVTPELQHLPYILLLGVLGALAHYTFNKAYELAEVTFLLPFGAAKLILCAGLSYMAFLEIPRTFDLLLGITIITVSTIVLSMPQRIFSKPQAATT